MRILHLIYDDIGNPWLGGGGAVRTLEVYSRIAERGHKVLVVCGNYPGAKPHEIRRSIRYRRIGLRTSYMVSRLTYALAAARRVSRGGYDLVVEDVSPYSPVAALLWKPRHLPAVASIQNLSGSHATAKYGPAGLLPRLAERPLLSLYRDFVAVSPGIAEELRQALGKQTYSIKVIPNGVDPIFFTVNRAPASEQRYILFLGRIDVYQKGLDTLIATFDRITPGMTDLRLVIAGGGSDRQEAELKGLVSRAINSDRIDLLGPVSAERAAELMSGALFLAMPSRYEAWPLTALEAGAAGVAVVGYDITGVRDAAPPFPKAHGLLVPPGDSHAFMSRMVEVIMRRELREAAGAAGREWAARFTWDALAAEQLAYYEKVIASAGGRT